MEFNTGDKVIALMDHHGGSGFDIIKGKEYTVKNVTTCECGLKCIDVGIGFNFSNFTECSCGRSIIGPGIWWINAARFTKNDNGKSVDVTEFMEIFSKKTIEIN